MTIPVARRHHVDIRLAEVTEGRPQVIAAPEDRALAHGDWWHGHWHHMLLTEVCTEVCPPRRTVFEGWAAKNAQDQWWGAA